MFMYIFLCWSRDLSSGDKVKIREDTAVVGEADEVGGELWLKKDKCANLKSSLTVSELWFGHVDK